MIHVTEFLRMWVAIAASSDVPMLLRKYSKMIEICFGLSIFAVESFIAE